MDFPNNLHDVMMMFMSFFVFVFFVMREKGCFFLLKKKRGQLVVEIRHGH